VTEIRDQGGSTPGYRNGVNRGKKKTFADSNLNLGGATR